jgi:hypothetical protein
LILLDPIGCGTGARPVPLRGAPHLARRLDDEILDFVLDGHDVAAAAVIRSRRLAF